jgi:hypothetical protein
MQDAIKAMDGTRRQAMRKLQNKGEQSEQQAEMLIVESMI